MSTNGDGFEVRLFIGGPADGRWMRVRGPNWYLPKEQKPSLTASSEDVMPASPEKITYRCEVFASPEEQRLYRLMIEEGLTCGDAFRSLLKHYRPSEDGLLNFTKVAITTFERLGAALRQIDLPGEADAVELVAASGQVILSEIDRARRTVVDSEPTETQ